MVELLPKLLLRCNKNGGTFTKRSVMSALTPVAPPSSLVCDPLCSVGFATYIKTGCFSAKWACLIHRVAYSVWKIEAMFTH